MEQRLSTKEQARTYLPEIKLESEFQSAKNLMQEFTQFSYKKKAQSQIYEEAKMKETLSSTPSDQIDQSVIQLENTDSDINLEEQQDQQPEIINAITLDAVMQTQIVRKTNNFFADRFDASMDSDFKKLERRNHNQIRLTYLRKLTYSGVWLPPSKQIRSHQNLILLDWDDTLLPTTHFLSNEDDQVDLATLASKNIKMLSGIQQVVLELLEKMIMFGKVIIVTNAKKGWVEYSSYYMMPRVHSLIDLYIPVISAQTLFEAEFPDNIDMWKQKAFQSLWEVEGLMSKDAHTLLNLMVVGDSNYEINAGKHFRANMMYGRKCLIKLIKLKEEPTATDLDRQLQTLLGRFNDISCSQKHVNLILQTSPAQAAKDSSIKAKAKK